MKLKIRLLATLLTISCSIITWESALADNDAYSVPVGLGIGKAIVSGKTVYNLFVEPQVSVVDNGPGMAEWLIFCGFNIQFAN